MERPLLRLLRECSQLRSAAFCSFGGVDLAASESKVRRADPTNDASPRGRQTCRPQSRREVQHLLLIASRPPCADAGQSACTLGRLNRIVPGAAQRCPDSAWSAESRVFASVEFEWRNQVTSVALVQLTSSRMSAFLKVLEERRESSPRSSTKNQSFCPSAKNLVADTRGVFASSFLCSQIA